MDDKEFWQICYLLALYQGPSAYAPTEQTAIASSIANYSLGELKDTFEEDEE